MNWLIIIVLVVLAFFFLRMRHVKHKIFLVILIILILFIYVTGSRVLSGHELDWKSGSGFSEAAKLYVGWLGSVKDNFKDIAGNVIKMDWKLNKTGS